MVMHDTDGRELWLLKLYPIEMESPLVADCWAKYMKEQFSWLLANTATPMSTATIPWKVSFDSPLVLEIEWNIRLLK